MAEHIIDKIKYGNEIYKFQDNVSGYIAQDALPDTSNFMVKGTDYVTAGQKSGTTLGYRATAEGVSTTASAECSHAEGYYTQANSRSQHVFGEYNIADSNATTSARGTYVEIVGNGTDDDARSNARTLDWDGNEVLAGKLTVGAAPTASMDVATKQYVDTAVANGSVWEVEYVTYNSSTSAEIEAAYQDGKTVFVVVDDQATQIYPLTTRFSEIEHSFTGYNPAARAPVEIACLEDVWSITPLPVLPAAGSAGQVLQSNGSRWTSALISQTWYGTSNTAAETAAKVVSCPGYKLVKGSIIGILFTTANTAATPTLNINNSGAKSIYIGNATLNATTNVLKWSANTILYFMYDGTAYRYITSVAAAGVAQPRGANTWYGTSSTATTTVAKTSTITNYVLTKGSMVTIAFSTANTAAAPTLNINSTGAKAIWYNNAVTSATNPLYWAANDVLTFIYNGTQYVCVNSPRQDNGIIRSTEDPTNASSYPANTIWIKYGADPMATMGDYITDTGTSGIWTYRKWNSGIAECWGRKGSQNYNMTTVSGNGYYSSAGEAVNLPTGLFTSITSATSDRCGGTTENGLVSTNIRSVSNNQLAYFVWNTVSGTLNVDIAFMVKGRWKE